MDYYNHQKIDAHSYLITEIFPGDRGGHGIGLFVGTQKACIVDTGWGVTGNLRKYVEQITDLPVTCLLTHPHPDHAGAAVQFDEVYMNPLDASIIPWALTREKRLHDASYKHENDPEFLAEMEREITDCSGFIYRNMQDGQRFDLGGVTIEAIAIPGHTHGSMVLYCIEDDILCTGDSIGPAVALLGEGDELPTPLSEYRRALARLSTRITGKTRLIIGHAITLHDVQILWDYLSLCEHAEKGSATPPPPDARLPKFVGQSKFPVTVVSEAGLLLIYSEL